MKSEYVVEHDLEYTSNGCDCCEPTGWDIYKIGTRAFATLEDVYEYILELEGIKVEVIYEDD